MVGEYELNWTAILAFILITIWLVFPRITWMFTSQLLLEVGIALFIWVRLEKKARLLQFFVKSFAISYLANCIVFFAFSVFSLWIFYRPSIMGLIDLLIFNVLPLSLLPVAITVIIYGLFVERLKLWEIFFPSWYVSLFVVLTIYEIWLFYFVKPYLPEFYYSSFAARLAYILSVLLPTSFLYAVIFTIAYVKLRKQNERQS